MKKYNLHSSGIDSRLKWKLREGQRIYPENVTSINSKTRIAELHYPLELHLRRSVFGRLDAQLYNVKTPIIDALWINVR